ncbi:uncharacterized protein FFMR_11801 [Fusarium fujikuroi]|nr:uncharacterized protein FFMR_11801 [Fusarium fujikuroi]
MAVGSPQGSLDVEPLIVGQMSKMRWSLQFDAFVIPNPTDRTPVIILKAFPTSATSTITNHNARTTKTSTTRQRLTISER